jgi:hypothetical protein
MTTKHMLLMATAVSAIMVSSARVQTAGPPLVVTNVSGAVRIQQGLPCGDTLDVTTPIDQGRVDMSWSRNPDSPRTEVPFDLAALNVFVRPFHADATCAGVHGSVDFREIGIQLAGAVSFTGEQTGGVESMLYRFRIPKQQFLIHMSVLDSVPVPQPETSYQRPSEDVTGLIDLRRQTVQIHVVLTTQLHFRAGCVGDRCAVDETQTGTTTSDVLGGNFSGTPPTVTCTPADRLGNGFTVSASSDAVIQLGTFTLTNNQVIQLLKANKPGVVLLPSDRSDGILKFKAGPGDGFLLATNASGLTAIAYCK